MSPNPTLSLKNRAAYAILGETVIAVGVIICKSTLITGTEYDDTIDAVSGDIIEYDMEND